MATYMLIETVQCEMYAQLIHALILCSQPETACGKREERL